MTSNETRTACHKHIHFSSYLICSKDATYEISYFYPHLFDSAFLVQRFSSLVNSIDACASEKSEQNMYTKEEEIKKRMKSLGYLQVVWFVLSPFSLSSVLHVFLVV